MKDPKKTAAELTELVKTAIKSLHLPKSKHAVLQNTETFLAEKKPVKTIGYQAKFWIESDEAWSAEINAKNDGSYTFRIASNDQKVKANFTYAGTFTDRKGFLGHLQIAKTLVEKLGK